MTRFYCSECWIFIKVEYEKEEVGNLVIDKVTLKCKEHQEPKPHHNTLRTHCKRGHLLVDYREIKGKISRYCKICARLAEQKHRDKNPGYHGKYKKKESE